MPTEDVVMPVPKKRFIHFANRRKKRRRRHNIAALAAKRVATAVRKDGGDGRSSKVLELRSVSDKARSLGASILEVAREVGGRRPSRRRGMIPVIAVPEDGQPGNGEAS